MLSEHQEFVILEDMYIWANAFMRNYVDLSFPREWENDNAQTLYQTLHKIACYFAERLPACKRTQTFILLSSSSATSIPRLKLVALHKTFRFLQKCAEYNIDPPTLQLDANTPLTRLAPARGVDGCIPLVMQVFENPLLLREISEFTNLHHLEGTCRDIRDAAFGVVLYRIKRARKLLADSAFRSVVLRRVCLPKQVSIIVDCNLFLPELTRRLRDVRSLEVSCSTDELFFLEVPGIWGNITCFVMHVDRSTPMEVPWLYKVPNVNELWLYGGPRVNLEGLDQMRNLESLSLDGMGTEIQLTSLSLQGMPRLKRLSVTTVKIMSFGSFGSLPALQDLTLTNAKFSSFEPVVRAAPNLRSLKISYSTCFADFSFLSALQLLESLQIPGNFVNPALAELPRLKKLILFMDFVRDADVCAPEALDVLSDLVTLEELTLHGLPFRDLNKLSNLVNLKNLGLSSVEVVDLRPLVHFDKLECLSLENLKINSHLHFEDLRALKEISISSVDGLNEDLIKCQRPDIVWRFCSFHHLSH